MLNIVVGFFNICTFLFCF